MKAKEQTELKEQNTTKKPERIKKSMNSKKIK